MKFHDLVEAMHECGVRSLPIVCLTSLLFGLILAFVGAVQLRMFGAQIYVAGLVGIGMLRVMGAVMVGIVMSYSSYDHKVLGEPEILTPR